jgi:hypothetical protein
VDSVAFPLVVSLSESSKEGTMRMPFGLDLKSIIVGALLVWFVVPWVMSLVNRPSTSKQNTM